MDDDGDSINGYEELVKILRSKMIIIKEVMIDIVEDGKCVLKLSLYVNFCC